MDTKHMPLLSRLIPRVVVSSALALASVAAAQPSAQPGDPVVRYDGDKVVRVQIHTLRDVRTMDAISDDMWSHSIRNNRAEYRVTEAGFALLEASGLDFEIVIDDLQATVDADNARIGAAMQQAQQGDVVSFYDEFKNQPSLLAHVESLATAHPALATTWTIGQSIEGRDIRAISIIREQPAGSRCRPVVFIHGVQHAREWISPMNVTYYIEQLLTNATTDPRIDALLDEVEFVFVPISNPDGFEYTWTNERFWRKNRRNNGSGSFGVDLNRNWSFQWGLPLSHGSAGNANPNSNVYWGSAPFSEPETTAISTLMSQYPNLRASIDVHSFGQMLLHPWAYTPSPSPDHQTFVDLSNTMRQTILSVYSKAYSPGTWYSVLYPSSGTAQDWSYGDRGAWAFTFELRGPGFNPPPNQILPCAEETFEAVLGYAETTGQTFQFIADWDHNCVYNILDYIAFGDDFAAGNPACDLDNSGSLNILDYILFGDLFAEMR